MAIINYWVMEGTDRELSTLKNINNESLQNKN